MRDPVWIRVSEAASRLGVKDNRTIVKWIKKGWLEGRRNINNYWIVTEDSVQALASREGPNKEFFDHMLD